MQDEYKCLVNRPNTGMVQAIQDGIIKGYHVGSTLEEIALNERSTVTRGCRRDKDSLENIYTENILPTETVSFDE